MKKKRWKVKSEMSNLREKNCYRSPVHENKEAMALLLIDADLWIWYVDKVKQKL